MNEKSPTSIQFASPVFRSFYLMKIKITHITVICSALCSMLLAEDIPGSKDPLGLKRYEGTRTTFYEEKSFDSYTLPLGKMKKTASQTTFATSLSLEGKVTRVTYIGSDPNRTSLEVYRNYQTELKDKGWEILWQGSESELSDAKGQLFLGRYDKRPGGTFALSPMGCRFLAAKKGGDHLTLLVTNY